MSNVRDEISSRTLPILPLRSGVMFPGTLTALPIGRKRSVKLVQALGVGDVIGVLTQRDASVEDPDPTGLYSIGTLARVSHVGRTSTSEYRLTLEGFGRFRLDHLVQTEPFLVGEASWLVENGSEAEEATTLATALRERVHAVARDTGGGLEQLEQSSATPGVLADQVASSLGLSTAQEMEILEMLDVSARLHLVLDRVGEARATSEIKRKIESDVRSEIGKSQREAILREQLKAIRKELGENKPAEDISALRERLADADLPPEALEVVERELGRLEAMTPQQPEHNVLRTYLELIADLPWKASANVKADITAVAEKLDRDHYGLEDVKKRILEHMAVLQLSGQPRGSILCLAGPPGVGKTSLGQSIADATGRPFVRVALGGMRDEAEIRGHRRTYVGALPGRILSAMRKAKVKNPVLLLDEIDKLFAGYSGSPEAALLEVLDPEQNRTFTDHYLEIPFDLSQVLFVCTANDLGALSAPLRDRLEIVELTGYTTDEKVQIARRHLLPKQREAHAIPAAALSVSERALESMVRDYTREPGVRQLTRELAKLCRGLALVIARQPDEKPAKVEVEEKDLSHYLGRPRYFAEVAERTSVPGVATGLAWTPFGGDILFIETSKMPGKGRLEITGQLGDVMKESAKAALSYVRSHAGVLGVDPSALEQQDLHIHVPAGAVPKDGPSAGVTMFTALTSLLSGRRVRSDTAMTGECTLRGRVLPVGGIKAKVLAAHRAGITRLVLPSKNARDLDDVPEEAKSSMEFVFADDMEQVIRAALEADETVVGAPPRELRAPLEPIGPRAGELHA